MEGTHLRNAYRAAESTEEYHCSFGLNGRYRRLIDDYVAGKNAVLRKIFEASVCGRACRLDATQRRDVSPELVASSLERTRYEASRSSLARSARGVESPTVVSANELVAVHLAFAEQRALVRAAALIGLEARVGSHDDDVDAID